MTWFLIVLLSLAFATLLFVAEKRIREWRIRRKLRVIMEQYKDEHFFQQLRHDNDDLAQG